MNIIQHRSIILLNIKCPQLGKPRQQWQGTKTPSGDRMEKKILGRNQAQSVFEYSMNSIYI